MKRVTGIGGIFFKSKNPDKQKEWYKTHLGIGTDSFGAVFRWCEPGEPNKICSTAWSPFSENTNYFEPSLKQFMINYRVENLEELIKTLKTEGVIVIGEIKEYEYGKFAWIMDGEGNKIELWEPIDDTFNS